MQPAVRPFPGIRALIAGFLMGLANLVPGVSGGTMVLVMGLYDEFISAVADFTRLQFSRRHLALLSLLGSAALAAIALLAGELSRMVALHRAAMYSLFIGLTLGGVPLLVRMLRPVTVSAVLAALVGLGTMIVVVVTRPDSPPPADVVPAAVEQCPSRTADEFDIEVAYGRDLAAGALGMSAMVLPGVSGAYMLLVLGRYEAILAAIAVAKDYVISFGDRSSFTAFFPVLAPTALGALISLVLLSNFLKWLLHRHTKATLGFLVGILLGCVVGIWPFDAAAKENDYTLGAVLALAGFTCTAVMSRIHA